MKYAVVYADFIRRAPYAVASASAQLAWQHLNVAAHEEENGGLIANCRGFDDRAWMARAGITCAHVADAIAAKLAVRRGNGLLISGYDLDRENAYKTNRANGQKGGRPPKPGKNKTKTRNPQDIPRDNPGVNPRGNPSALPSSAPLCSAPPSLASPDNGGGGGGSEPPPPPPLSLSETQSGTEQIGAAERDHVIAALIRAMTRGERSNIRTTPNLAELETYLPALAGVPVDDLEPAYAWFLGKLGKNGRDTFWKTSAWSLHVFVTQGLPAYREWKQAKVIEADIEAQRLAQEKAARAARRQAYIARLRELLPAVEAAAPRPCHFHDCETNHDIPPPQYLTASERCVYCVRTDLARLTKKKDIQPQLLRLASGGAS